MIDRFIFPNGDFVSYTAEHYIPVVILFIIGFILIYSAHKYLDKDTQYRVGLVLSIFLLAFQVSKILIFKINGHYSAAQDLPFHLCNVIPFFLILMFYYKSKWWFSIVYFWIFAGTIQSNITPTLTESFPHYEYWRYWLIHTFIPILAIYPIICFGWRLKLSDAVRSALGLNALAAFVYIINLIVDGNYMYLMHKPLQKTLYDYLGPWPWYIFNIEMMMLILFPILLIPFGLWSIKHSMSTSSST